jgi:hypothetical protein
VPKPAAGMITITFMAGCQYTSGGVRSSNRLAFRAGLPSL